MAELLRRRKWKGVLLVKALRPCSVQVLLPKASGEAEEGERLEEEVRAALIAREKRCMETAIQEEKNKRARLEEVIEQKDAHISALIDSLAEKEQELAKRETATSAQKAKTTREEIPQEMWDEL